jgi:dynein heavy chain, axonemal
VLGQGLLTAALQQHARRYGVAIDDLELGTTVTKDAGPETLESSNYQGILVHGLWIDGGRWDFESHTLEDPLPGVMFSPLPVVNLIPQQSSTVQNEQAFECPLYKTSDRTGALSTTGQSTNFVTSLALPIKSGLAPDHWVLRGVALLCMPDE